MSFFLEDPQPPRRSRRIRAQPQKELNSKSNTVQFKTVTKDTSTRKRDAKAIRNSTKSLREKQSKLRKEVFNTLFSYKIEKSKVEQSKYISKPKEIRKPSSLSKVTKDTKRAIV